MDKRGKIALLQIVILIFSIISFSLIISGNMVSAGGGDEESKVVFSESTSKQGDTINIDVNDNSNEKGDQTIFDESSNNQGEEAMNKILKDPKSESTTGTPTKAPGLLGSIYGFNEGNGLKDANVLAQGGYVDGIVSAASWGMTAYGIVKFAGGMFFDDEGTTNALSMAAGFGALAE